jgi:deoxyinosine 3'endonuclease (endonuclease V)
VQRADWFEMSDDPDRARALQRRLAAAVVIPAARVPNPETLTGLDVSYQTGSDRLVAAAVTMHSETGDVLDQAAVAGWATYPYRSGLLALREVPPLLAALDSLRAPPDLLLCDGQGILHPRRFGLACHLALATGIPAIGVAKTRFVGTCTSPPDPASGSSSPANWSWPRAAPPGCPIPSGPRTTWAGSPSGAEHPKPRPFRPTIEKELDRDEPDRCAGRDGTDNR